MIDKELAAFLQEGIAIQLGTRNANLEPNGTRAVAVKVEDDGRHVVAYVPKRAAAQVVPDLEANGQAALVFARPPDERACQVKGVFVEARAARASERSFVAAQWDRWVQRLGTIGFPPAAVENWQTWPCVAVRVRVTALFNQTPGPGAGAALS
ncbi:MAG: pyridoxamine 5'-phosphate oxidase family protein [Vicinamibacterales bacterium]